MFDRLYQENWLEQVTMKKGQSNWSIASLCSELVAKMAKDIGMTIRKGIVVPFLPCLVAFWGFHPYMFFFFNVFLLLITLCSYINLVIYNEPHASLTSSRQKFNRKASEDLVQLHQSVLVLCIK